MARPADRVERFLRKVTVAGEDECWLWNGCLNPFGYGAFRMKHGGVNRTRSAQRSSFLLFRGDVPDGLLVCHTCDVPRCVNPRHLFLGTPQDNMTDAVQKGRKIRRPQLAAAVDMAAAGMSQHEIARRLGVSHTAVWKRLKKAREGANLGTGVV